MATSIAMDPETPPSGCPLKQVPLEVLLRITDCLPTVDLGSMRLTCRAIEEMLYNSFTREFFTRRQFMIGELSLQALVDMSKSRIARHIRRLQFKLEEVFSPGSSVYATAAAMKMYSDHVELLNSGRDRIMITEALKGLCNLEDVVIRDFDSPTRNREGRGARWQSYGAPTLLRDYEIETTLSHGPTGEKLFATLLQCLGEADARPKGIEIMGRNTAKFSDYAFVHHPDTKPSIGPVLENLTKLHLTITSNGRSIFDSLPSYSNERNLEPSNLAWFLTRTPNLKDLRINQDNHDTSDCYVGTLMTWLGETAPAGDPASRASRAVVAGWPEPVHPPLEEFSCSVGSTTKDLSSVLKKFAPTLKSISLWKVLLRDEYSISEFLALEQATANAKAQARLWRKVLGNIAKSPGEFGSLRKLMVGGMREDCHCADVTSTSPWRTVKFGKIGYQKTFAGSDWRHNLLQAIDDLEGYPLGQNRNDTVTFMHADGNDGASDEDEEMSEDD